MIIQKADPDRTAEQMCVCGGGGAEDSGGFLRVLKTFEGEKRSAERRTREGELQLLQSEQKLVRILHRNCVRLLCSVIQDCCGGASLACVVLVSYDLAQL